MAQGFRSLASFAPRGLKMKLQLALSCHSRVQHIQWPTGTDLLEVPTIDKACILGLNFRDYPHKIWPLYGTVPPLEGTR